MPRLYAPRKITVTTTHGAGMTLQAGEYRTVGPELFAAALQQGAYPAPEEYTNANLPASAPLAETSADGKDVPDSFAAPGVEGSTIVGEDDEDDRYPAGATTAPTDEHALVAAAMRRLIARNDPKDFNNDGVPKARALTAEMGGQSVVAEVREKVWEQVNKEIAA